MGNSFPYRHSYLETLQYQFSEGIQQAKDVLLKLYSFSLENCKCTVGDIKNPEAMRYLITIYVMKRCI